MKRADASSKSKFANIIQITHRDQVETPITDWLQEAYDFGGAQPIRAAQPPAKKKAVAKKKAAPKKN